VLEPLVGILVLDPGHGNKLDTLREFALRRGGPVVGPRGLAGEVLAQVDVVVGEAALTAAVGGGSRGGGSS
jgi:hypothetical protein